jgi:hypothetical protein
LIPSNSAYASGSNGLPPVVIHPTHSVTVPLNNHLFGAQPTGNQNNSANNTNGSSSNQNSSSNLQAPANGQSNQSGNLPGNSSGKSSSNSNGNQNHRHGNGVVPLINQGSSLLQHSANAAPGAANGASLPAAGYNLDLSSTASNIVLGSNLFNHAQVVTINVGGSNQSFSAGQKVTAAEYIAIQQQLSSHAQTLVLDSQGAADNGKFTLNSALKIGVNELVVPNGVTAIDYFSKNNSLSIGGDLLNYGSIYGLSTNSHITGGSLSAADITNESGGIISTVLPSALQSSFPNAIAGSSLTLKGLDNITNSGVISSSAGLTLATASGAIGNVPATAVSSQAPMITAASDVNLSPGNGNLTNAGMISSKSGNINIATTNAATDINIQGHGGTFQATAGNINVRSASYVGDNNINLNGGNYLTNNLNLYSGQGAIEGNVGQVSGNLNTYAQVEHFGAASNTLVLGNNTINGDPTYANAGTGAAGTGNIVISGTNLFTEDVAILAAGNITATSTGAIIDDGPAGNNNITLVAGPLVTINGAGGGNSSSSATLGSGGTATALSGSQTVTVDFSQGNGGNIDLRSSNATTVINAQGASAGISGGTVILAALPSAASGGTGGQVLFNTASNINTTGNGTGEGGSVFIFAGLNPSTPGVVVQLGSVTTSGSTVSGSVNIYTSQPTGGSGSTVTFGINGNGTSNTQFVTANGVTSSRAQVLTGDLNTNGAAGLGATPTQVGPAGSGGSAGGVFIFAGSNITTGNLFAYGGGGGGAALVLSDGGSGGSGQPITLTSSNGSITVNGVINSSGGGGGGYRVVPTTGGPAGQVTLTALKSSITVTGGIAAADGGGGGASVGDTFTNSSGAGGGGGASLGGAGGGAGGSGGGSNGNGGGGGGGGGFSPGGGGGSGDFNGNSGGGGSGGGFGAGAGAGGVAGGTGLAGSAGSGQTGGNGAEAFGGSGGAGGGFAVAGGGGSGNGSAAETAQAGVSVLPVAAGQGASIFLSFGTITAGHNQPLELNANASGFVTGGTVSYSTNTTIPLTIDNKPNDLLITATSGSSGGNGGSVTVSTTGPLIVNPGAINVAPQVSPANGGNLTLIGSTITGTNPAIPIVFNSSGLGTGNGGSVSISTTGVGAATIGFNAGNFSLFANSGPSGGSGGLVSFSSGGNLLVNPNQITANAVNGNGGVISLQAGASAPGVLLVTGSLSASGTGNFSGGGVELTSNSTTPFNIGATAGNGNGVMGSITINGANGFVVATNNDGGVTNSIPLNISRVTLQANAAGSVMVGGQIGNASSTFTRLVASGTGSVFYPGTSFAVLGSTVVLGAGGTIGSSAAPLLVNSPNVNVINAGGNVTITDFSNGATLTTTPVGGALSFMGTGFIEVLSAFTSLGNVSIVNSSALGVPNGSINLDGAITAPTISLTTNGTGNLNTIGTGQAIAPTVNLTIQGSGAIGGVNPFSIAATNVAPTTTGLVNISDNQSMTLTGSGISAASKVSLSTTNNGNIVVHGQIGNDSTGAVTISAGGSGSITANADIHGNALVLTSGTGAIGTLNAGALPVVSTNFSSSTGGFSNIIDTQTSTAVTVGTSSAASSYTLSFAGPGPLTLNNVSSSAGPIFVADSGNITLGTLTASTNITVFTQSFLGAPVGNITVNGPLVAGNAGGTGFVNLDALKNASPPGPNSLILVNTLASIQANNGKITLEQDNTTNGSIVIGNGSLVRTLGANGGAVNIVIGTVPTTPIQGTTPANVTINHASTGTAYFGANGISVPTGPATLTLQGSNIVFNTGSLPAGAIILGSNVAITADPTVTGMPNIGIGTAITPAISPAMAAPHDAISRDSLPALVPATSASYLSERLGQTLVLESIGTPVAPFGSTSASAPLFAPTSAVPTAALLALTSTSMTPALSETSVNVNSVLSANAGLAGAVSSTTVLSALGGAPAYQPIDLGTSDPEYSQSWISDTELFTGKIPAIIFSERELGVTSDVSTVVEIDEQDDLSSLPASASTSKFKPGVPLTGAVSRNVSDLKFVNLKRGSVVFAPVCDTVVHTSFGDVRMAAKSIVLVISFEHGLTLFDLDDTHAGAVVIDAGNRKVLLRPGMHASFTRESSKAFADLNPAQLIGHRNMQEHELDSGVKAFVSEFSLPHALQSVTPLTRLANSKNLRAQKLVGHLFKTAALLEQMNTGSYELFLRRQLTACQFQP